MKKVKLLDVCNVYQPKTVATKYFVENGPYVVYGANGPIGKYSDYNHEESEVLMACRGATCGAINVSEPYSWINGNAMVIKPNGSFDLDKKFLKYYLMYAPKDSIITGTAQPQITRQNLKHFIISICDISEQQRIVARIEELFSQLDDAEATLQKTKAQLALYRQAVLKEAFESVPARISLGNISESRLGKMLDKEKNKGIARPYLRNINVRWFEFDMEDLLEMRIEENEVDKYSLRKGDLVICEGGEPGRCAVWEKDDTIFYQKALHRVRFTDGSNPRFYMYYLWYAAQTGQLKSLFTGTGIKHLTGQSLVKTMVPKADRSVQNSLLNEIESRLSVCDSIEQTVDVALKQLKSMRQSILKKVVGEAL